MNKMYMHLHMNNKALNGSNCELRFVFPIDMQWITMDSCNFIWFFLLYLCQTAWKFRIWNGEYEQLKFSHVSASTIYNIYTIKIIIDCHNGNRDNI